MEEAKQQAKPLNNSQLDKMSFKSNNKSKVDTLSKVSKADTQSMFMDDKESLKSYGSSSIRTTNTTKERLADIERQL